MYSFLGLKQRASESAPRVAKTTIAELSTITALPAEIRASLGSDDQLLCVVNIDSSTRRYTLLLDLEWVTMAAELDERPGNLASDLPLPRAAVRAVVNGWMTHQAFDDPASRWSDDNIPHVGFPLSDDPDIG